MAFPGRTDALAIAAAALLALASAGCVAYSYERTIEGTLHAYERADRLEAGRSTVAEAFALLGSPDLVLRVKEAGVNRYYYTRSIAYSHKIIFSFVIPIFGRGPAVDLAVLADSHQTLWVVRLDSDPSGVLTVVTRDETEMRGAGQYMGISGAVVSTYLEDKERALHVDDSSLEIDEDDDDDEDEIPPPDLSESPPEH